jgi:hypothetical protein
MVSCPTRLRILPSQMLKEEIKIGAGGNKFGKDKLLNLRIVKNIHRSIQLAHLVQVIKEKHRFFIT